MMSTDWNSLLEDVEIRYFKLAGINGLLVIVMVYHDAVMALCEGIYWLTHWDRVTHICVSEQTIIGSYNGLSTGRRQAIIWTSAGILLIGPLVTNFSEILIEIHNFLFKKMHLKMSSGKWRPFCLGLNLLTVVDSAHKGASNTGLWCCFDVCLNMILN